MGKIKYKVEIITRDFQGMVPDDYHATVTRVGDGVYLIWTSQWRWFLNWQLKRRKIDRAFKRYDDRKKKLARKEERVL